MEGFRCQLAWGSDAALIFIGDGVKLGHLFTNSRSPPNPNACLSKLKAMQRAPEVSLTELFTLRQLPDLDKVRQDSL